jgi:hypothetical protein
MSGAMPLSGAIIFGDLIGKLDVLYVHCPKCNRVGRYRVDRLIEDQGRNAKLIDWLDENHCRLSEEVCAQYHHHRRAVAYRRRLVWPRTVVLKKPAPLTWRSNDAGKGVKRVHHGEPDPREKYNPESRRTAGTMERLYLRIGWLA